MTYCKSLKRVVNVLRLGSFWVNERRCSVSVLSILANIDYSGQLSPANSREDSFSASTRSRLVGAWNLKVSTLYDHLDEAYRTFFVGREGPARDWV